MRFKNFAFFHEDFSSGHLFETAAAHYQATGKKTLLTVATRLADLFDNEFGPGRQDYIAGHEGIELALVRLSRMTGEKRYLELAKAMPDRRGQKPSIFERQFKQLDRDRTMIDALEQADNVVPLRDIVLPASATFQSRFDASLAGGVIKLTTEGLVHSAANWDRHLYQPTQPQTPKNAPLTAVPYAIWGNRGLGEMIVWIDASQ